MKEIIVKELKKHIDKFTWEFLKAHKCMLVGGALTSILTKKDINDFDIYFKERDSFILALLDVRWVKENLLKEDFPEDVEINHQYLDQFDFRYLCHTEKSVTFKPKSTDVLFQFIHQNFYENVAEVFNDFDFTVNMLGYDFELDEVVVHKDALLHLSQRILVTNSGTKYPLISILRTNKYQERGYTISKKELIKLLLSVNKLEINSYEDVGKHIGGLYGTLDITEMFDITKEFNIDEAIEQLSNLEFDALDTPKFYKSVIFDDALLEIILGEYYHKLPYTKLVSKYRDTLVSDWDKNYTYTVGVIHYPSNPNNPDSGIYCTKGIGDSWYGNTLLELEPQDLKENVEGKIKFGYKNGVLVKQVLPFTSRKDFYNWLVEEKEFPVDLVKYLKAL